MTKKYTYLDFISDEDLFSCIDYVYSVYTKKAKELNHKNFVKNKLDPFKMMFDMKVQDIDLEGWIKVESSRQMDKALSNAMGTFHELLISKSTKLIRDSEKNTGVDLYNSKKTIFVEIKNKHNTVKGENKKDVFKKLKKIVDNNKGAKCYYLVVLNTSSINKPWEVNTTKNGKKITLKNKNVKIISVDRFYKKMLKDELAFKKLIDNLPKAIEDYLSTLTPNKEEEGIEVKQKKLAKYFEELSDRNKRDSKIEVTYQGFEDSNYLGF